MKIFVMGIEERGILYLIEDNVMIHANRIAYDSAGEFIASDPTKP